MTKLSNLNSVFSDNEQIYSIQADLGKTGNLLITTKYAVYTAPETGNGGADVVVGRTDGNGKLIIIIYGSHLCQQFLSFLFTWY